MFDSLGNWRCGSDGLDQTMLRRGRIVYIKSVLFASFSTSSTSTLTSIFNQQSLPNTKTPFKSFFQNPLQQPKCSSRTSSPLSPSPSWLLPSPPRILLLAPPAKISRTSALRTRPPNAAIRSRSPSLTSSRSNSASTASASTVSLQSTPKFVLC